MKPLEKMEWNFPRNEITSNDILLFFYFMQLKNHASKRCKKYFFNYLYVTFFANISNVLNTRGSTKTDEKL